MIRQQIKKLGKGGRPRISAKAEICGTGEVVVGERSETSHEASRTFPGDESRDMCRSLEG